VLLLVVLIVLALVGSIAVSPLLSLAWFRIASAMRLGYNTPQPQEGPR